MPAPASDQDTRSLDKPTALMAWTLFVLPAVGVPSVLMLQDTLKSAVAAFGILLAALLFFWQQRHRTEPLCWHGLVWLPVVLMIYALGSMVWSHPYLAGVEAIRWFLLALLLWLGLNTLTLKNLPVLLWGIHGGAVVAAVWAALQFWLNFDLFPQGPSPASTFINRNFFAEYLVCTLPFSVLLLARMEPSRGLILLTSSLVLNTVALMMTGTRSALIATWVLLPILILILVKYRGQFGFSRWSKFQKMLVVFVLIIGVGVLGSIPSKNPQVLAQHNGTTALERSFLRAVSMTQPKEYTQGSFSVRSAMWKATARMMMAHALTGVGAGAWEVEIPLYQPAETRLETDYYAHNEFLQLLSEYGLLVGGVVLAFLIAYWLTAVGKTYPLGATDGTGEAPLRAFTLASLLALFVVSNAGFPWHLASCGVLMAVCLAILANSDARLGHQDIFFARRIHWKPIYSRVGIVLVAFSLLLTSYITYLAAQAERKIVRALQLSTLATKPITSDQPATADAKAELLRVLREGIAINPHYRKLTAIAAEPFSAAGDWANAAWILESVAASRPHVTAIWSGLARAYSGLGQHAQAMQALQQVTRLQPHSLDTTALKISLLSRAGQDREAILLLHAHFDQGLYSYDIVQIGYALGYKTRNWPLAVRSLEIRNHSWPQQAADGHLRLGKIYTEPEIQDRAKAIAEFKSGLAAVPAEEKLNYLNQLPPEFRSSM